MIHHINDGWVYKNKYGFDRQLHTRAVGETRELNEILTKHTLQEKTFN